MTLHLVIGEKDCLQYSIETVVEAAVQGGVTHVQLREKKANKLEFMEIGWRLKKLLKPHRIPLLINDNVEIALALDAEGVHLGQSDMYYPEARALLGVHKIIGLTVETVEHIEEVNNFDVAYVGVGPVFQTHTKLDAPVPLGISGLKSICRLSQHSVVAIGGINVSNAQEVLEAGAEGIAVISAITHAINPREITHRLSTMIRGNRHG